MTDSDWRAGWTRSVVAYFDGTRDADRDDRGRPMLDDDLLVLVNGWWEPLTFTLPDVGSPRSWTYELDTFSGAFGAEAGPPAGRGRRSRSSRARWSLLRAPAMPAPPLPAPRSAVGRRRSPRRSSGPDRLAARKAATS